LSTPVLRLSGTSLAETPPKNPNAATWHSVHARWSIFSAGRPITGDERPGQYL